MNAIRYFAIIIIVTTACTCGAMMAKTVRAHVDTQAQAIAAIK